MHDLERSWQVWLIMEATNWRFLPYPGGLLEQPTWLLEDLIMIKVASERMKEREK